MPKLSICIIGFGKVGKHLAAVFERKRIPVRAIYNRSKFIPPTDELKSVQVYHDILDLPDQADIYILSVSDDVVRQVAGSLPSSIKNNKIVAHTSGIHSLDIFPPEVKRPGVFYPLNTFSPKKNITWSTTPIYISGETKTAQKLRSLAQMISNRVYTLNDEQKKILHLAAVITNNFPTHLFIQAHNLLKRHELDFTHLRPLIITMVKNLDKDPLESIQTGPALRGDEETLRKHLELLSNNPQLKEIYRSLSKSINKDLNI